MSEQGITGAANNARVLDLTGVQRTFYQGRNELKVLRGVDLVLRQGEIVALVGPSGSGKSTLLHIAGLLEPPDAGDVAIAGQSCNGMNDLARTTMRREHLGFVYQNHHLLPEFSALENVAIPAIIDGLSRGESKKRAREILGWMGLEAREDHRPARLSGGEQQRVAIARALASKPSLLLADEPTGNLDPATASDVFEVLLKLVRGAGLTALIATHNPDMASRMDRIVNLESGRLIEG
ncbi:MAG TPA: ABC transporter ATP-binding protein [Rhodospirillales bacterium]|jgi:lipoprotein-releasing system ATP-binding protein|nr:MAG: Lipoprotein-releasing system ATP-binding protein LolD [Alphaproteobacteria bacterium MarineAlpha3_Bin1]PPR73981.1 MAG: Lipoprotein-releasing system ATP-binding protein LolD [Alphaproteobacteria bacterium MarineAlpha3_Bin2]HIM77910.1 ABC transporter ATP-binding protein [Rhodospirillales bacterium]